MSAIFIAIDPVELQPLRDSRSKAVIFPPHKRKGGTAFYSPSKKKNGLPLVGSSLALVVFYDRSGPAMGI
jgi:hypothetical protein